ncbi:MAG: hypothetical protein N2C12_06570 [Planctomycetales bacterium]
MVRSITRWSLSLTAAAGMALHLVMGCCLHHAHAAVQTENHHPQSGKHSCCFRQCDQSRSDDSDHGRDFPTNCCNEICQLVATIPFFDNEPGNDSASSSASRFIDVAVFRDFSAQSATETRCTLGFGRPAALPVCAHLSFGVLLL